MNWALAKSLWTASTPSCTLTCMVSLKINLHKTIRLKFVKHSMACSSAARHATKRSMRLPTNSTMELLPMQKHSRPFDNAAYKRRLEKIARGKR